MHVHILLSLAFLYYCITVILYYSVLYWSKSSDFSLNKLDLATKVSTRVDTGSLKHRLQIKLLTFEPENNILFWYNSYNNTIEGFNISETIVTIIASVNPNDTITGNNNEH